MRLEVSLPAKPQNDVENTMKHRFLESALGWLLTALLAAPLGVAMPRQQAAGQPSQSSSSASSQTQSPGLETRSPGSAGPGDSTASLSNLNGQAALDGQAGGANPPVGTAAAPYENPSGAAASRPAGAVIAPAKQRRKRSILIKVGIVVGAGAAIAAVALLSHASPSRPH